MLVIDWLLPVLFGMSFLRCVREEWTWNSMLNISLGLSIVSRFTTTWRCLSRWTLVDVTRRWWQMGTIRERKWFPQQSFNRWRKQNLFVLDLNVDSLCWIIEKFCSFFRISINIDDDFADEKSIFNRSNWLNMTIISLVLSDNQVALSQREKNKLIEEHFVVFFRFFV